MMHCSMSTARLAMSLWHAQLTLGEQVSAMASDFLDFDESVSVLWPI